MRVDLDPRLKLEFHRSKVISDARGALAYRKLDEVLGLTDLGGSAYSNLRRGRDTRHHDGPWSRRSWPFRQRSYAS